MNLTIPKVTHLASVTKENVPPCEWYFKCSEGFHQTLYFLRLPNTEFGNKTYCPNCGEEMRQKFNCYIVLKPGTDIQVSTGSASKFGTTLWTNHKLRQIMVFMHVDRILTGTGSLWLVTEAISHLLPDKITSIATISSEVARTFNQLNPMLEEFNDLIKESVWARERIALASGSIKSKPRIFNTNTAPILNPGFSISPVTA